MTSRASLDLVRQWASQNKIVCAWCGAEYTHSDGVWNFKINADGFVACAECRRDRGMAWGEGPWLFLTDLLRAKGLAAAGSFVNAQSPLQPRPVAGAFNGWLHPDGRFFPCESWDHDRIAWSLAEKFGYDHACTGSRVLEEHGWIKLKSGDWIIVLLQECTQRQVDTLFDWCQSTGRALESLELL